MSRRSGGTDAQLATLLGPQASQDKIAALRRAAELAVMDEAACFAIGAADPTHPVDATPSTTQMACSAGSKAALAALVVNLGIAGAITALVDYALSHPEAPSSGGGSGGGTVVDPQPVDPETDPSTPPGADPDPSTPGPLPPSTDEPDNPDPVPSPQPDPGGTGGGDDSPDPSVDTCQLPPGPDPVVFYFYQREAQVAALDDTAGFRVVGAEGKIWLTDELFASAADAVAALALPSSPPDGYFEVPADRLQDLYGPYCVEPNFGQPGGGIEYWTTQEIYLGGLEWHPFP